MRFIYRPGIIPRLFLCLFSGAPEPSRINPCTFYSRSHLVNVAPYANILYRIARFVSGLPPNAGTYLLAVAERPEALVGAAVWAADTLAGDLFSFVLKLVFLLYVWSRLPAGVRRSLTRVVGYFLPGAAVLDPDQDGAAQRATEMEARLRELERRLESRDGPDDGDGGER